MKASRRSRVLSRDERRVNVTRCERLKLIIHLLLYVVSLLSLFSCSVAYASTMSQSHSLTGDTPLKKNAGATGVFISGTLEEQRTAVLTDLGNIPEVTVDFMLDNIVPDSGIDVNRTRQHLIDKGILLPAGWKEFSDALPKKSAGNEQQVFSKMETIYRNIIALTKFHGPSHPSATLVMGTCPDIVPISETSVRTRPDGCGQLDPSHSAHTSQCRYPSQRKEDYHWFNIAYVEEYKKNNTIKDLNDVCPLSFLNYLCSTKLSERIENIVESTSYDEC